MPLWYSVSLLVAGLCLTSSAPTPEDCDQLVKPLPTDNPATMFGSWIFIEGFTDHPLFDSILKTLDSSWIHISPSSSDHKTLTIAEENELNGKCNSSSANMTFADNTIHVAHEDSEFSVQMLPTCPDCVVFSFNSTLHGMNTTARTLYILGRNRTLKESDLEIFRKQAECLQFSQPPTFHYNPDEDLCHEDKFKV